MGGVNRRRVLLLVVSLMFSSTLVLAAPTPASAALCPAFGVTPPGGTPTTVTVCAWVGYGLNPGTDPLPLSVVEECPDLGGSNNCTSVYYNGVDFEVQYITFSVDVNGTGVSQTVPINADAGTSICLASVGGMDANRSCVVWIAP